MKWVGQTGQYAIMLNKHITLFSLKSLVLELNYIVLQQSLNKSLSFQDSPTGGTSFVNIYKNVRLDP